MALKTTFPPALQTKTTNARVVWYLRASEDYPLSLEQQRALLTEEQARAGLPVTVVAEYVDEGESSHTPLRDRLAGGCLMRDAQSHTFGTIWVARMDCLSRSLADWRATLDALYAANVGLYSATEPISTHDPAGQFAMQTAMAMAASAGLTELAWPKGGRA
jgi:DNA invertase Pin-like site-specific DNA recombinase